MDYQPRNKLGAKFSAFAGATAKFTGRPYTFLECVAIVLVWAACGPIAKFSDTWQLIINTSTTIITFLMVFLIQNTQNRDSAAIQAKLDELIRSGESENRFIGIEHLSDEELDEILKDIEQYAQELHAVRRTRKRDEAKSRPRKSA